MTTDREDWGDNLSPAEFMRAMDIVSSRLRVVVNEVDHYYRFSGGDWEADTAEELAEMIFGCWREESHAECPPCTGGRVFDSPVFGETR